METRRPTNPAADGKSDAWNPWRISILAVLVVGTLLAAAGAKRRPPVPCLPGAFELDTASVAKLSGLVGMPLDAITFASDRTVTLGACTATGTVKAKRKATIVTARFPACGTARKAKLAMKIAAPDCGSARGSVRAKRAKPVRFTAVRTAGGPGLASCGNAVVDAGEACDWRFGCSAAERCSAECACVPASTRPASSQDLIVRALASGQIDYPTSLVYRVWALFQDPRLPEAYDGAGNAGEDTKLFLDLSRVRSTLPAPMEAQIAPYLVRPNDPSSIYSQPPPALLSGAGAAAADPPPVGCPEDTSTGLSDWRPHETAHFVVWSCGGGTGGADADGAKRPVVGAIAEEIWAAMTPKLAVPRPDDNPVGPAPQNRIDIYLVGVNQCRSRAGGCAIIPPAEAGKALAAATPATPCGPGPLPLTSSGYVIVDRAQVPSGAPGVTPSPFRYILAHELFHVVSYGLNFEAQGGTCAGAPTFSSAESWLTEASADWLSWALFPNDWPERRTLLFGSFQNFRNAVHDSLLATDGIRPYEAYIYPFFIEQEAGDPGPIFTFWKESGTARTPEDLDTLLDSRLGFATHFRDFTVRNLNRADLPGNPIPVRYAALDAAIAPGILPIFPEPGPALPQGTTFEIPTTIQPLAAQYDHYTLPDPVRWLRIDGTGVGNAGHLDFDVIANARGTWERRRLAGPVFEICRDDAKDDTSALYLVATNHARRKGDVVSGNVRIDTRATCPAGWSGFLKYVLTDDSVGAYADANEALTKDDHLRTEDTWTFASPSVGPPPDSFDMVDAVWSGSFSQTALNTYTPFACLGDTPSTYDSSAVSGSATGPQQFIVQPSEQNPAQVAVFQGGAAFNSIPLTSTRDYIGCVSGPGHGTGSSTWAEAIGQLVNGLGFLDPDADDPDHYAGRKTLNHSESPGIGNGVRVYEDQVEWDIRRHRRTSP